MARGVTYAVALFFFTGSVCLAGPLQNAHSSSPNFGGSSDDLMETMRVKQFMEQCPKNPPIQWQMREALNDFHICIHSTIEGLSFQADGPGFTTYGRFHQMTKKLCTLYISMQPCVQDYVTRMDICLPDYSVEDVISAYQAAINVLCVNDAMEFAAALMELAEEDEKCLHQILVAYNACPDTETEYSEGTGKRTLQACRTLKCVKKAVGECGGEKMTVKKLINDGMAAMNRYVPCSSAHGFRPSISLSAAALITLIAAHFRRRDSLF